MKRRDWILALAAQLLALTFTGGVWAEAPGHADHSHHPAAAATSPQATETLSSGVVRKVDREARKVTLRHGPIPHLEMPEMTMVFQVADPKMLDDLAPSQTVLFRAERIGGQLTLTHVEPSK